MSGGPGQVAHRQRRGGGREHGVLPGVPRQLSEHLRLAAVVLDHRLDEEGGVCEIVQAADDLNAVGIDPLFFELCAGLGHGGAGPLRRGVGARPQKHVPAARGRHCQPARDRARAGDSDSFLQLVSWV